MSFPHLSEVQSSFTILLMLAVVGLILPFVVDRQSTFQRSLLVAFAALLAGRYAFWRITQTVAPFGLTMDMLASWSLLALEMLALVGSTSAFLIMTRHRGRSEEATENAGWWDVNSPKVAILIATCNETLDVLERTVIGAKSLRHDNKEVIVLDDGRRDWLRDYCASQQVRLCAVPTTRGPRLAT
ncbi:glycosyltransferase [Sulfitobacter guttiformis]|uniref:glycosyltransferase n=1 Tax=Sulfitobacter guttiformis TaxID=74349 RepID=UPI000A3D9F7A|nr:glycosyltransferase [Sulfitobacter guttiformis]KIN72604.1 Glycosyl transferase, family 2 [Sulfitobacter guttiformis KCTC 32187]